MTNPNDPAFELLVWKQMPLTKREYFAGLIIASMHARSYYDEGLATPKQRANIACIDADALIDRLKKGEK